MLSVFWVLLPACISLLIKFFLPYWNFLFQQIDSLCTCFDSSFSVSAYCDDQHWRLCHRYFANSMQDSYTLQHMFGNQFLTNFFHFWQCHGLVAFVAQMSNNLLVKCFPRNALKYWYCSTLRCHKQFGDFFDWGERFTVDWANHVLHYFKNGRGN